MIPPKLSWLDMPLLSAVFVILVLVGLTYGKGDTLKVTASIQPLSIRPGTQAKITATLRNLGNSPIELEFPSSKTFDFAVSGQNGHYRWSTDRFFLTVITKIALAPGQEIDATFIWTVDLPPGDYRLRIFLEPISGSRIESEAVDLVIRA